MSTERITAKNIKAGMTVSSKYMRGGLANKMVKVLSAEIAEYNGSKYMVITVEGKEDPQSFSLNIKFDVAE